MYRPVAVKSSGHRLSFGISCRGLPRTSWIIWKQLGSSVSIGRILRATGLYFFPANIVSGGHASRVYMCGPELWTVEHGGVLD